MRVKFTVVSFILASSVQAWSTAKTITVDTTSGRLLGTQAGGVASFRGIRFAQPPVDGLRWEPPTPFLSSDTQNATSLGPSCLQQFPSTLIMDLFNNPRNPPPEDEDCLFLNVWAPNDMSGPLKPVVVWIYGGGFTLGTASVPMYDGASFAKNQDIVFVSFNYRTNVFGFPTASELPSAGNNLGFLDQELALAWVQDNIAQFGGDKSKVTLMGQSAGAMSISLAITRRNSSVVPPFRAAILLSGEKVSASPQPNFKTFETFATAMGCSQPPGPQRLQCLRNVSASAIHNYTTANPFAAFTPQVDNVTFIDDSLQAIRAGQIPRVPVLLGGMEDEGTIFAPLYPNVTFFLGASFGRLSFYRPPNVTELNALYPGLNDTQLFAAVIRDVLFRCPTKLWSDALVTSGINDVYRYTYGAKFPNLQPVNNLGVWHGSELFMIFATFSKWTASADEIELSNTLQTTFANFVKDPGTPPAPNWPAYNANASVPTLAKLAYHGNVETGNFIDLVDPSTTDGPCQEWDQFLDFRP